MTDFNQACERLAPTATRLACFNRGLVSAAATLALVAVAVAVPSATASAATQPPVPIALATLSTLGDQVGGDVIAPSVSDDGGVVVWSRHDAGPVWARDMVRGVTERVDVRDDGTALPPLNSLTRVASVVSGDGRWVALLAGRRDVYLRDLRSSTTISASVPSDAQECFLGGLSDDGRFLVFTGTQPDDAGVVRSGAWLFDRTTSSRRYLGAGEPVISGDGSTVVLVEEEAFVVFLTATGETRRVLRPAATYGTPVEVGSAALSDDGRLLTFTSRAAGWVLGDTNANDDVFVLHLGSGVVERASVTATAAQASGSSASISDDGRLVSFQSRSSSLAAGDTNNASDVFVKDRLTGVVRRTSTGPAGEQALSGALAPALAGHGGHLVFESSSQDLVYGDNNDASDIMLATLPGAVSTTLVGTGGEGQVTLAWRNPTEDVAQVMVRAAPGDTAPDSPSAGDGVYVGVSSAGVSSVGTSSALTVRGLANGQRYSFALFTTTASGALLSRKVTTAVPVAAAAAVLSARASASTVTHGGRVTLTGRLTTVNGTGISGEPVDLYGRHVGATSWTRLGRLTTSTTGTVAYVQAPLRNYEYTLRHPLTTYRAAASGNPRVLVLPRVAVSVSAASAPRGTTSVITGFVTPAHASQRIYLQRYSAGAWRSVTSTTLSTRGGYRFSVRPSGSGTFLHRLVKPADTDHGRATTGTMRIVRT